MSYRSTFVATLSLLATSLPGLAGESAVTPDDVILTIGGNISPDAPTHFDIDALKALPATVVETSTVWTKGTLTFTGIELVDLVEAVGGEGDAILATALNDYAIEIPMEDAVEGGALLAYLVDGKEMAVREKGPLWIVYPFDDNPEYNGEKYYSRSIWQLARIDIVDQE
ncbi:molybdopterin-dependent oxidoreductase [Paracoccus seriniphilus]|uniref:molybdopterin-dependent oxidoreductase n=1 Tax=Paracoccus seriniphilus TaxID=184748 RepID=UPI0035666222